MLVLGDFERCWVASVDRGSAVVRVSYERIFLGYDTFVLGEYKKEPDAMKMPTDLEVTSLGQRTFSVIFVHVVYFFQNAWRWAKTQQMSSKEMGHARLD